jgi:hypothetical protein
MSKFIIKPKSGSLKQSENVQFEITELDNANGLRIYIENATDVVPVTLKNVKNGVLDLDAGQNEVSGEMNLNIPEQSSQTAISLYASIQEFVNNKWVVKEMATVVYPVSEDVASFNGGISINPAFIGANERTTLSIQSKANERFQYP